jgi:hypothetical protein
MVAGNFLCSVAVAGIFWFTDLRGRLGHARTANHHGRCPPDRISRPHMGRECLGSASAVRFRRLLKALLLIYLSMRMCLDRVCLFTSARWRCPKADLELSPHITWHRHIVCIRTCQRAPYLIGDGIFSHERFPLQILEKSIVVGVENLVDKNSDSVH